MNELEYIRSLAQQQHQWQTPVHQGSLLMGPGDDCAVIRKCGSRVQLLSMDTLVEAVHFDRCFHPPELLGRKVISVNVSDIAAMGGIPTLVLLSAGLPPGFDANWVLAFNQGLLEACQHYNCSLIGGDTVASPGGFSFTITILGEMEESAVLYRDRAREGDTVFVSGFLGLSAGGLALLKAGFSAREPQFAELISQHLNPTARVQLGAALANSGLVHAMMDSSDGLATDLAHICSASQLGAQILAEQLPISDNLREAARLCRADPLDWALRGGEDFELIFTAPPQAAAALRELGNDCSVQIHAIGVMDRGEGLRLLEQDGVACCETFLTHQGYDHFRRVEEN
ncbi:MAG: thiamine-phosphate kinase [Desulfobulbaceae bacterium]|nr:thiamine-phosphate kinase [Desulfobulbaceae bacterium]